jgi:hypothetical protein
MLDAENPIGEPAKARDTGLSRSGGRQQAEPADD